MQGRWLPWESWQHTEKCSQWSFRTSIKDTYPYACVLEGDEVLTLRKEAGDAEAVCGHVKDPGCKMEASTEGRRLGGACEWNDKHEQLKVVPEH